MDWEVLIADILSALVPIVIAFFGFYIVKYIKDLKLSAGITDALEQAYTLLADCVKYTNQVLVDGLKAEGKFDADAQAEARQLTINRFKQLANDEIKLAITTAYNNFDEWIITAMESKVRSQKEPEK